MASFFSRRYNSSYTRLSKAYKDCSVTRSLLMNFATSFHINKRNCSRPAKVEGWSTWVEPDWIPSTNAVSSCAWDCVPLCFGSSGKYLAQSFLATNSCSDSLLRVKVDLNWLSFSDEVVEKAFFESAMIERDLASAINYFLSFEGVTN